MNGEVLIGIDLGGTNCRAALVSLTGEILVLNKVPTKMHEGRDFFLARLFRLCDDLIQFAAREGLRVSALGMGAAGVISPTGTVTVSPNLAPLNGFPLAAAIQDQFSLPTTIANDANAIAWGEGILGAGRIFSSFLTITLGTGVGGGLILDKKLWKGTDGSAGEIGHFVVEPEGRECRCGSRGCLEQYASATGIVRTALECLERGEDSVLAGLEPEDITSLKVSEAARGGDAVALKSFRETGERLGQVLASVANLLNLDGVVITGGPAESLDLIRPWMEKEIKARAFDIPFRRMKIVRGELGEEAGILGSARLAHDELVAGKKRVDLGPAEN
ncbi:MAG: ROK family protein [Desulfuromonadaceae bacterium]|nr:ROK family protein [Desulfuromonadaceae bacterium]